MDPAPPDPAGDGAVSLAVLIRWVASGDESAFSELYDRTSSHLLGVVRGIVDNAEAAETACQEAFLEIWRTARHIATVEDPVTHLLLCAHRHALQHLDQAQLTSLAARPGLPRL